MTKGDLVAVAIVVLVNLAGLTAPFWAPSTQFGQWMSTDPGRVVFVVSVLLFWLAIELLLKIALALARRSRSSP